MNDVEKLALSDSEAKNLRELIPFRDLSDAIKAGQTISYYNFTHSEGQHGAILIIHRKHKISLNRAAITFGGDSEWGTWDSQEGDWDEERRVITLDEPDGMGEPVMFNRLGQRVSLAE